MGDEFGGVGVEVECVVGSFCKKEDDEEDWPHALVLTCPAQGHINPMLQFSKRLHSKGTKVTFLLPSPPSKPPLRLHPSSIHVVHISDGSEVADQDEELSLEDNLERLRVGLTRSLEEFLDSPAYLERPAKVLIYDSFVPYVLDVALRHRLHGAPFFTQSAAVCSIYYLAHAGNFRIPPVAGAGLPVVGDHPELSMLGPGDLPSFMSDGNPYPELAKLAIGQLSNFREARWMLFNTFVELEEEVVNWMVSEWPLLAIGPTVPSMYLDKRLKDDKDYGASLFEPEVEDYMKWLDSKETGSVAYVSFGSFASLGEEQMEEIGARIGRNGRGIFTADEITKCIDEIMFDDRGREIRQRSTKWKELAQMALREGGSSDRNIDKFVKELVECTPNSKLS
ncbi:hypothetical protein MLD38_016194 [Melastoma candidum]|uniref:Uncharacterized protein n=1 Tax=Melastoma candidum TaxID=119954 RepID=A0ACB9RIS7_9MYRT|nr:hypothetical protein MLD38_016194 [Melastoma candidum]